MCREYCACQKSSRYRERKIFDNIYTAYVQRQGKYHQTPNFRISAHRLEVELGRYNKTPREDRICTWCSIIFSAHHVENEEHLLNHCDINAVARRNILNKINIITSKSSDRTPNSTIHTISPDTNLVNLISNHNDILTSLTRARYIS